MQTHYECPQAHVIQPLPASPNSSRLLSSPSGFFLLLGQVRLAPAPGPLHSPFLTPRRLFPWIFYDGLILLCQVLAQMSLPRRGCADCLSQVVPLSEVLSAFNNLFYFPHNTCNRLICCLVLPPLEGQLHQGRGRVPVTHSSALST